MRRVLQENGFTLAEMLVAIAVATILAGFVAYTAIIFRRSLHADTKVLDIQRRIEWI